VLITGRQLEHWHTGSMTRRSTVLDAMEPMATAILHGDDLARLGVQPGCAGGHRARGAAWCRCACAATTARRRGTVFMPFAYVEAAANLLTNAALDPFGKIPEFKYCAVFSLDKETAGLIATVPTNRDLLFWSQPQRDAAFRALDRISLLAKWHDIPASGTPSALPPGPPLKLRWTWMPTWQASAAPRCWCCTTASCVWSAMAWTLTAKGAGPASPWPSPHLHAGGCAARRLPSRAWTTRSATTSPR
jgi:hypothetical protein